MLRTDKELQPSVAETSLVRFGMEAWPLLFAVKFLSDAQTIIEGGVLSSTVTVAVQELDTP